MEKCEERVGAEARTAFSIITAVMYVFQDLSENACRFFLTVGLMGITETFVNVTISGQRGDT